MKKLLFVALLFVSPAAMAQTAPVTAPSMPATPGVMQAGHAQASGAKFDAHKSKALEKISQRLTELQQKQSCVQAATDGKALEACFPNRGKHEHKDGCKE